MNDDKLNVHTELASLKAERGSLIARVSCDRHLRLVAWWNALMPFAEFHLSLESTAEGEDLEIVGRDKQVVFRFTNSEPSDVFGWDGALEVNIPTLMQGEVVSDLLQFKLYFEGNFLILEEAKIKTILLDLESLGGKSKARLDDFLPAIAAAYLLGQRTDSISQKLTEHLTVCDVPMVWDRNLDLSFYDLSEVNTESHLLDVLRMIQKGSVVVIGGQYLKFRRVVAQALCETEHQLVVLEMFGQVDCCELDAQFLSRAHTFREAVDLCYTLAEEPTSVYFLTGIGLTPAPKAAMARRFQNEVIACS